MATHALSSATNAPTAERVTVAIDADQATKCIVASTGRLQSQRKSSGMRVYSGGPVGSKSGSGSDVSIGAHGLTESTGAPWCSHAKPLGSSLPIFQLEGFGSNEQNQARDFLKLRF